MERRKPQHLEWTTAERNHWDAVIAAGVKAQQLVPGAVAVGGTAAALYAQHRLSLDTDHLLPSLKSSFDEVLSALEQSPQWKTARIQPPVLILGSIDQVQVGFRQARHEGSIEASVIQTDSGPLAIPTLDEMVGMKAYLTYARNALRDYLDFAALASCTDEQAVINSLGKSDQRYGHLQTISVAMEIASRLSDPNPTDLLEIRLVHYKGLAKEWQSWERIASVCRHFGELFGRQLVLKDGT